WPANGGGTKEYLYEVAANTLVAVVSGLNLLGPVPANGTQPNGGGVDAMFMAGLADRIVEENVGFNKAWGLALELYKRYEARIMSPDPGKPFWELYDVKKITPRKEWLETINETIREIAQYI
ncbi:monomethylamine:corrinoid methyltransferase, partial [Thermofilum sp.]